jgi:hypothetical protein
MSEFVPNPSFMPDLERAVMRELDDVREEMYQDVKRRLSPGAITDKVTVRTTPAKRTGRLEVGIFVGYGRGLGPIFEGGTVQRSTRRGFNRGQITTANFAMRTARDNAVRRGLSLRYL